MKKPSRRRVLEWARRPLETDLTAAKLELGKQQERAANAERSLLELQERAKPRTISVESRDAILAALLGEIPAAPIEITYIGGSVDEPGPLARVIADLLRQSKWTVASVDGGPFIGTPPAGILVRVSDRSIGEAYEWATAG